MHVLILFVILISAGLNCAGQTTSGERVKNGATEQVLLNQDKPSVYLEYLRSGVGPKHLESDSENRIWLKMVNNSVWRIGIIVFPGDGRERGLFHSVEKIRLIDNPLTVPPGYKRGDTGFYSYGIESGDSFVFSVPANHLAKNLLIRINFTYSWESACSQIECPLHSVVFTHTALARRTQA